MWVVLRCSLTPRSRVPRSLALRRRRRFPFVAHAPDGVRTVIADKQRAILRDRHSNRTSPDFSVSGVEAGEKVFVLTAGMTIFQRHSDDFISGALAAVP